MIYRSILKVKTVGSRIEGNLHPIISEDLPIGFNSKVLEYDEANGECIMEIWGSDHSILEEKYKVNKSKLDKLKKNKSVVKELSSHSNSGGYRMSVDAKLFNITHESPTKVKYKGKEIKFKRILKDKDKPDMIVIEEVEVGE